MYVTFTRFTIFVAASLAAAAANSHHGSSMYDLDRTVRFRGVVTGLQWTNPHVYIEVTGLTESGDPTVWIVESVSQSLLSRIGWDHEFLVLGETVVIEGNPARDIGKIAAWGKSIRKEDGTLLELGGTSFRTSSSFDTAPLNEFDQRE